MGHKSPSFLTREDGSHEVPTLEGIFRLIHVQLSDLTLLDIAQELVD